MTTPRTTAELEARREELKLELRHGRLQLGDPRHARRHAYLLDAIASSEGALIWVEAELRTKEQRR